MEGTVGKYREENNRTHRKTYYHSLHSEYVSFVFIYEKIIRSDYQGKLPSLGSLDRTESLTRLYNTASPAQ